MKKIFFALAAATLLVSSCGEKSATEEKMQIYLCIGQSNMAGQALIEPQDTTCDARLLMMPTAEYPELGRTMGEWYHGTPPQCSEMGKISPADYFGRTMVEYLPKDTKVGLVSVAVSGCDIGLFYKHNYEKHLTKFTEDWYTSRVAAYGNYPYGRLIEIAKKAQKDGEICGIILHQGESNTGDKEWPKYVKSVYDSILVDLNLNAEDVPLIAGEVAPKSVDGKCAAMNPIINTIQQTIPTAHVVSAEGCEVQSDRVHFSANGVREIGRRYAMAMLEAKGLIDKKEDMQIYLCFGQSNMAGSAEIEPQDTTCSDRLVMMPTMNNEAKSRVIGQWSNGTPPQSGSNSGLSPADYFGRAMVEKIAGDTKVGLVTVAIGGCDIRIFDKDIYEDYLMTYKENWFQDKVDNYGRNPYQALINGARAAQTDGKICGIILHQGETNTGDSLWTSYVNKVYNDILTDLHLSAEDVPLIAGEVVPQSADGVCATMNGIIATLPEVIPTSRVVSGEGCGVREDNLHYNSEGVRELGRRYADAMIEAQSKK